MDTRRRSRLTSLLVALISCNDASVIQSETVRTAVADAQRKCTEAAKGPVPQPWAKLPVEKFDECIAAEANNWPAKTREAICALGRSGGASGSTVEVYMFNGKCQTDYE